jgi:hypothetical protein
MEKTCPMGSCCSNADVKPSRNTRAVPMLALKQSRVLLVCEKRRMKELWTIWEARLGMVNAGGGSSHWTRHRSMLLGTQDESVPMIE